MKRNLKTSKVSLKEEIEKIVEEYIGEVTEDTRRPEMIKKVLTLFSTTIDSVIGRQDRKYMYANKIYGIAVRDLRKQMRARKKLVLSDNEGELLK